MSAYIPPHLRPGASKTPPPQIVYKVTLGDKLVQLGFTRGAGGQYYYPAEHPHAHIIPKTAGTVIAYSEGKQHLGGRGIQMYENGKLKDYQLGLEKLEAAHPGIGCKDAVNQAAMLIQAEEKQGG